MKLKRLIKNLKVIKTIGNLDVDIKEIKANSNHVTKDCLFICITGRDFDGHKYLKQAEQYGAVAVITESQLDTPLTQVVVENSRIAMSIIAGEFYGNADKKLKIVGVVGTNGKTTTTHLIRYILENNRVKCGVIGTLGCFYNGKFIESDLTTPDPLELHKLLRDMYDDGVEIVAMEVSAHAIELEKVNGINFEVGVFTNFSQDHLDFFQTMDNYKNAKLKFFKNNKFNYVVTNSDDKVGLEILNLSKKAISYGIENPADVFAMSVLQFKNGTSFVLNLFDCVYNVNVKLLGKFNVYNSLASCTVCALLGVKPNDVVDKLQEINNISGRLERVYDKEFSIYVDYAHTPDGLEKTLKALKPVCQNRLICVFGCGGNRDTEKRGFMGSISGKLANFTIITSDNPRFEEPMDIINTIEEGLIKVSNDYVLIQDRVEAIDYAIKMAKSGDVIVVAGKGSEKYQDVLGIKHLYNDKDTIKEILKEIDG